MTRAQAYQAAAQSRAAAERMSWVLLVVIVSGIAVLVAAMWWNERQAARDLERMRRRRVADTIVDATEVRRILGNVEPFDGMRDLAERGRQRVAR